MLQKDIMKKDKVLETPHKPIRVSYKVFKGKHAQDIHGENN